MAKRAASDKGLFDKPFEIANNSKYDGHKGGLASRFYMFLDKKFLGKAMKIKNTPNEQLADRLHKLIRKFRKKI